MKTTSSWAYLDTGTSEKTAVRSTVADLENRIAALEIERREIEFVELACRNCGGKIQQKYEDPIMKCPYCKTVYAVGTRQINSI